MQELNAHLMGFKVVEINPLENAEYKFRELSYALSDMQRDLKRVSNKTVNEEDSDEFSKTFDVETLQQLTQQFDEKVDPLFQEAYDIYSAASVIYGDGVSTAESRRKVKQVIIENGIFTNEALEFIFKLVNSPSTLGERTIEEKEIELNE